MSWSHFTKIQGLAALFAVLAMSLGCAGGWRNGPPAGAESSAATSAAPAASLAAGAGATADEAVFVWKGEGGSVAVAGEFNTWNTSADPMTKQADGSWKLVKKLPPGRYPYKFVIDGNTWKADPDAKESVDDGYGGKNSVMVVGSGAAAPAKATEVSATTGTAGAGKGKAPVTTADGTTFTFAGAGNSVNLAGDFNSWSTSSDSMKKQADGTWTITKKIAPGSYGYKFVVNGSTWVTDAANPEGKDDGFGGKNSVVVVP